LRYRGCRRSGDYYVAKALAEREAGGQGKSNRVGASALEVG
jgi:hypothetical protein